MFGVDTADGSRHRAFRIGVPARFPAGRPAAPHGGKAAMAGSHALRGFPILLEWESRMEEGWRPEIPHPQGFPPCRNLLWQRAAGSPASVGFSPIRATAGSAGRRKPHTRGGCPFPRVRMEGASPSSAGGFPTPEIYRSLTKRKPRIRKDSPPSRSLGAASSRKPAPVGIPPVLAVGIFSSVRKPHTRRGSFLPLFPRRRAAESSTPAGVPLG